MREITLDLDGEWLVLSLTRPGRDRVKRVYLGRDEAAVVAGLIMRELGEVTTGVVHLPGRSTGVTAGEE